MKNTKTITDFGGMDFCADLDDRETSMLKLIGILDDDGNEIDPRPAMFDAAITTIVTEA